MKQYMEPAVEVVELAVEDIITASGGNFDNETDEL